MANKNRVVGQAKVKIDGDILDTDGTSTLDIGGPKRTAVNGDYQAGSFSETTAESKMECTILLKAGLNLTQLGRVDNATLTMETDVGQTFIVRNAYVVDPPTFATNDGKAKVTFQGPPAEQV